MLVQKRHWETVLLLVRNGADLDWIDGTNGRSALWIAVSWSHLDVVWCMLQHGVILYSY